MRRLSFVAVCILILFSANSAMAEFYRWFDSEGKEFFTNDPLKVPSEYRNSMSKVTPDESRVSVGDKPAAQGKPIVGVPEHKDKYGRGEEYWRKRALKLRNKLRGLQDEFELIVRQERAEESATNRPVKKRTKITANRVKKKAALEKKIERAKKELETDLPEEARKADAYPGWIRE
jgi:hypothetical protein